MKMNCECNCNRNKLWMECTFERSDFCLYFLLLQLNFYFIKIFFLFPLTWWFHPTFWIVVWLTVCRWLAFEFVLNSRVWIAFNVEMHRSFPLLCFASLFSFALLWITLLKLTLLCSLNSFRIHLLLKNILSTDWNIFLFLVISFWLP